MFTDFMTGAQEELTAHLVDTDAQIVTRAKRLFQTRSEEVEARLRTGDRTVKRGRVVEDADVRPESYHVRGYWQAVASKLPCLSLVARSLLACCASEAGVERLFSKEGFIHNSYRNRLSHNILLPLLRACINRHALDAEVLNLSTSAESDSSES